MSGSRENGCIAAIPAQCSWLLLDATRCQRPLPVAEGVSELRVDYGPGYRVYYTQHRGVWFLLLCGGDTRTQDSDIKHALRLARELED
ncbi:type II toxin-antitoxin system RelE/ParE family toxin [Paraburkholderia denitrificans]|uniref:Type II toxin-antitoxin system RelE/ParE family toxin n=1 Tax=Paraburkholderia denitrificans TaxID=694025 RepID=A0ABW0J5L8_9BURK